MSRKIRDLTGQRFGKLFVVKRADDYISPKGKHYVQWLCKCDCGMTTIVIGESLKNGYTKSCGCSRGENISKANKKYNTYDLSGEYGIGYTSKGEEFWFDLEDYNKIKDYCWWKNSQGYIMCNVGSKSVQMHRLIMDFPDSIFEIDHKHGELSRYDNRKSNLRIATHSQNQMNKSLSNKNKSGVTGVSWREDGNRWVAHIGFNGNRLYKSFNSFDDAVKQRKEWELEYFGEWSYDNSNKN